MINAIFLSFFALAAAGQPKQLQKQPVHASAKTQAPSIPEKKDGTAIPHPVTRQQKTTPTPPPTPKKKKLKKS